MVVYHAMQKKTIPAPKKLDFLKKYAGILVHDHETALYHFGTGHAECNVHLLRYLRKNTEDTGNKWSSEKITLLCGMNKARKSAMEQGEISFTEEESNHYEQQYHSLICERYEKNQKPSHKYAKTDEKKLLNRMKKYSQNHLLFLQDYDVLYD